jgi:hypothetical protein
MEDEMVDRGNVDKHRLTYSGGVKAVEAEKWGRQTARSRYGKLEQPDMTPKDGSFPQFKEEQPTSRNPGEIPVNSWLRGGGEKGWPPGKGRK